MLPNGMPARDTHGPSHLALGFRVWCGSPKHNSTPRGMTPLFSFWVYGDFVRPSAVSCKVQGHQSPFRLGQPSRRTDGDSHDIGVCSVAVRITELRILREFEFWILPFVLLVLGRSGL